MKAKPSIAIAGATGLVGSELVSLFEESALPYSEISLFASEDSVGEMYRLGREQITVELLSEQACVGKDLVFLALPGELAERYAPVCRKAGAVVIDLSGCFSLDPQVPLIAADVNLRRLSAQDTLIANPSGTLVALCAVLQKIHAAAPLKRVVVSTYQACAGAGKAALDELWEQTLAVFNQREMPHEAFAHQIAFNVIPQIDLIQDNGDTREERRLIEGARRILEMAKLPITATAVRIPVFHGDAQAVNVELERELSPGELMKILSDADGIALYADAGEYPMPVAAATTDQVHVGRIRRDESAPFGLNLWIVADSLRRGTALNALRIAKYVVENFGA